MYNEKLDSYMVAYKSRPSAMKLSQLQESLIKSKNMMPQLEKDRTALVSKLHKLEGNIF